MKPPDAAQVVGDDAVQVLLVGAVQEHTNVQALITHHIRHITDQEEGASLEFGFLRHGNLAFDSSRFLSSVAAVSDRRFLKSTTSAIGDRRYSASRTIAILVPNPLPKR